MANEYEDIEDLIAQQEAEESGRIVAAEKARREAEEKEVAATPSPTELANSKTPKETALQLVGLGFIVAPSTPCGWSDKNDWCKPGKSPIGAWKVKTKPSYCVCKTKEDVEHQWDEHPAANVGVICGGESGVYCLDIDRKEVKQKDGTIKFVDGFKTLRDLGHDLERKIPPTIVSQTPSGGWHVYFKCSGERKIWEANPFLHEDSGLDIRGEKSSGGIGGFAVEAPSSYCLPSEDDLKQIKDAKDKGVKNDPPRSIPLHGEIRHYKWIHAPGEYEIMECPDWLLDLAEKAKDAKTKTPPPIRQASHARTATDEEKRRRASAYLAKCDPAIDGQHGHNTTFKNAIKIVVGFDLDDATAYDLLANEYNSRCSPPWSEDELRHKIEDARKEAKDPPGFLLYADRPQMAIAATDEPDIDDTAESDKSEELDWSKLIEELPGLVGEIARYALSSMIRPQPKFAVLTALVTVATVYNRTVHDNANNIARIFGMAICPNGGGKDPVLKRPPAIIEAAFHKLGWHAQIVMSKAHSESAIADELAHCPVKTILIDEVSGFFKQAKAGEKNGASIATVKGMLKTLYSFKLGETYEGAKNARVQGKSLKRIRVNTPCVSFAGVTQDDMLPDAFQEADIKDGLLPRNIFFISETRPRKNYDVLANPPPIPKTIIDAVAEVFRMQHWEQADKNDPSVVTYSDAFESFPLRATAEALARQREYGESCDNRFEEMDAAGKLTASIWVRADENARGVALVIAAGRAGVNLNGAEISLADVELAIRIITACANDACRFLEGRITDDRFDALKVKIRRFIGKAGEAGRTQTEITRGKFGDPKFRDLAIKEEVSAGYVKAGQVCRNGRTADAYFITKRGAASL